MCAHVGAAVAELRVQRGRFEIGDGVLGNAESIQTLHFFPIDDGLDRAQVKASASRLTLSNGGPLMCSGVANRCCIRRVHRTNVSWTRFESNM